MTRLFLGAYWPSRKEPISRCATRLSGFFNALTDCDELLAHWYETGYSRKQALQKKVDISNREVVLDLLVRGRNRTDIGKKVIKELGFSTYLWNGRDDSHTVGLRVACGGYSKFCSNCINLNFAEKRGGLNRASRMKDVLVAVATAWEPDWAGVMSEAAKDSRGFGTTRSPFIDWMVYLSRDWLPTLPSMAPPASAEPVGSGTIIVVQDDLPDPANEEHFENIRRVETSLQSAWKIPERDQEH